MKKLLLAAAATAAFSSSAFADCGFYLRGDAGYNKFNNSKNAGVTQDGKYSPAMEMGVGYDLMDNVRAEFVYGYQFPITKKGNGTLAGVANSSAKVKAKIQTLMVKGYVDVADLGMAQIFAGAGVGMAQISGVKHTDKKGNVESAYSEKKVSGFTYSLALGSAFDIDDSVKLDVQYNFQDFGKTSGKISNKPSIAKTKYNSHAIKAGVRFAI